MRLQTMSQHSAIAGSMGHATLPRVESLSGMIVAPRTDPVYNCHTYLTKVPIGAIQPFIEAFTEPGEVVADFFAGSGMTGLAALQLNRRARLSDISVLGQHIACGYLTDLPEETLRDAGTEAVQRARAAIGPLIRDEGVRPTTT